jgi:asparagine synthase (glutamine-hydrolysing)
VAAFAGGLATSDTPASVLLTRCPTPPEPLTGWDARGQVDEGHVARRWALRWTTPEARRESLPVPMAAGRRLVYSGRVDNRDELIARYGASVAATDGALLAAAIERDGPDGLRHVVGDFALACWDADGVLLARDAMGQRPLFIYRAPGAVFWSTDLGILGAGPARRRPWRRAALGDYLCWEPVLEPEALVDGVDRVLPATWVHMPRDGRAGTASTYWTPPRARAARRADAEWIDEFRHRFEVAVTACLRADRPPACQLSGGLDSSLVTALAARAAGTRLDTYSLTSPGLARDAAGGLVDESQFVDAVVAATGARSVRWDPREVTLDDVWRLPRVHGLPPEAPNGHPLQWHLAQPAAADGHRVMLTGLGGDFWLTGSLAQLPARLAAGDWRGAWRFAREARGDEQLGATPQLLAGRVAAWLAPAPVKVWWRRRRRRPLPEWLSAELAAEVTARHQARERALRAGVAGIDDLVLADDLQVWAAGEHVLSRELVWATGLHAGIELRHPFADRRVAEFVVGLPDDLRFRHGLTRYIQRQAFATVLPPLVRDRRSKGDGSFNTAPQMRLLLGMAPPLERPEALAAAGLVRESLLADAWQRARCDAPPSPRDLPVFFAAALERCFRSGLGR